MQRRAFAILPPFEHIRQAVPERRISIRHRGRRLSQGKLKHQKTHCALAGGAITASGTVRAVVYNAAAAAAPAGECAA